jgi:hypothetical protein
MLGPYPRYLNGIHYRSSCSSRHRRDGLAAYFAGGSTMGRLTSQAVVGQDVLIAALRGDTFDATFSNCIRPVYRRRHTLRLSRRERATVRFGRI